jgi:hypothetical protein
MLLSTRDIQRVRRNSQILAGAAIADRLTLAGIDNASFQTRSVSDILALNIQSQSLPTIADEPNEQEATTTDGTKRATSSRKRPYAWKMTHYFYIHVGLFIINGLFCGLIVYLIENYSSVRNHIMEVAYVDAWFVSSSCVYNCGLTTIDFANLSSASQIILMVFTFISGITISTLPALVVKAHSHKKITGITVDDDHGVVGLDEDDELPTTNTRRARNLPQHIKERLASLPSPAQLRYRAYITCIVLILGTCFTVYTIAFVAIGGWLSTHYTPEQLLQGNSSINPWYISFIVTVTGFNQNGLAPFSSGFARFVDDVYLNLFVILVKNSKTILVLLYSFLFFSIARNVWNITFSFSFTKCCYICTYTCSMAT